MPNLSELPKLNIGKDVKQELENDLALELGAVHDYNEAVATCRKAGDNGTADFLKEILTEEEGHVDFFEEQLGLIEQVGLQNYLAQQLSEGSEVILQDCVSITRSGANRWVAPCQAASRFEWVIIL